MTASEPLAARGVDRFIDGIDHLGDLNTRHVTRELIAATRPTHTGDQTAAPQLGEQLFEIGQADALALGDAGQRDRTIFLPQGEVEHRSDCEASFGGQSHRVGS